MGELFRPLLSVLIDFRKEVKTFSHATSVSREMNPDDFGSPSSSLLFQLFLRFLSEMCPQLFGNLVQIFHLPLWMNHTSFDLQTFMQNCH